MAVVAAKSGDGGDGTFDEDTPDLELYGLDKETSSQLCSCQALAQAVGSTVAALSEAGSALQRKVAEAPSADLPDEVAPCLLRALGILGADLVGLAAILTGDVVGPLQELARSMELENSKGRADLQSLRRQEVTCAQALHEHARKKDQAVEELKRAVFQCQQSEEQQGWMSWRTSASAASATKLQGAASLQTATLEAYAEATEAAALARLRARQGERSFRDSLHFFGLERRSFLKSTLRRCASAWGGIGASMRRAADEMLENASQLERQQGWHDDEHHASTGSGALPAVANSEEESPEKSPRECSSVSEIPSDPHVEVEKSRAELESSKCAWKEVLEARELSLLEKEAALLSLEERLEAERQLLGQRRRAMAYDQARSLALLDRFSSPGQDGRLLEASLSGPLEACAKEGESAAEGEDEVWDMDWNSLDCPPPKATPGEETPKKTSFVDKDELQRKLTEKRHLAELYDGQDLCPTPKNSVDKGRMPGVHPSMAEKLERRRRMLEEACQVPLATESGNDLEDSTPAVEDDAEAVLAELHDADNDSVSCQQKSSEAAALATHNHAADESSKTTEACIREP